jgi:hypothetical protein
MNKTVNKTVSATLRNTQRKYAVQLDLQVLELWGQGTVPDEYVIERVSLALGRGPVEDDDYTLEYSFNGKQEQQQVRVANGMLLSKV